MTHRVLPALGGSAVVGELPLDPLVDLFDGEGLGRRAFQRHEDHTGKGERRLVRVLAIVALVSYTQDDVEHLLR